VTLDQNLRPDASMDKLAKLKPLDTRSGRPVAGSSRRWRRCCTKRAGQEGPDLDLRGRRSRCRRNPRKLMNNMDDRGRGPG
jgi:hypothetical protein